MTTTLKPIGKNIVDKISTGRKTQYRPPQHLEAKVCTTCPLPACVDFEDERCPLRSAYLEHKNAIERRKYHRQKAWREASGNHNRLPLWCYGVSDEQEATHA